MIIKYIYITIGKQQNIKIEVQKTKWITFKQHNRTKVLTFKHYIKIASLC